MVPIAGRNAQLPVLQHVLLQARGSTLHLTTTDLEVGIQVVVGGKVEGDSIMTVPARGFLDYIAQLPSANPITIERKKTGLFVSTQGFQAQFPVADGEDFPLLPDSQRDEGISIDAGLLCGALSHTLFAAAREETRPEIRSVYMSCEGGELRLAATDSFRLSEQVIPLDSGKDFSFLLPLPSAQEVVRLFSDEETVTIAPHENHVLFFTEGVELSSRLIDGTYPDYRQIIPTSHTTQVVVSRDECIRALKTLAVFLPRDSRRVQLEVKPKTEQLLARVVGGESGQGEVELAAEGEGGDIRVLVNIQYLLEGLQRLSGDQVVIEFGGNEDPIVFRPSDANERFVYVVMPIQAQ